jgi:hypothetical protein
MLSLLLLFSVSIILLTVFSCSADSSSNIIGKWELVGEEIDGKLIKQFPPLKVIEFFSDKTMNYRGENYNWTILEDGRIKIISSFIGIVSFGLLQGDILKLPSRVGRTGQFDHYRKKK